jgi:hypothetical protein
VAQRFRGLVYHGGDGAAEQTAHLMAASKQRERTPVLTGFLLSPLLFHLGLPAHGIVPPSFRAGLPYFINPL